MKAKAYTDEPLKQRENFLTHEKPFTQSIFQFKTGTQFTTKETAKISFSRLEAIQIIILKNLMGIFRLNCIQYSKCTNKTTKFSLCYMKNI